jgi:quercetin dioxygenase-like cupin family protein
MITSDIEKFIPFLAARCTSVKTPCEGFTVIQLGPFDWRKNNKREVFGAALVLLEPGGEHPQHKHEKSDAVLHFMGGRGYVILGENQTKVPYEKGVVIEVSKGTLHGFEVIEPGVLLSTQTGASILGENGELDIEYVEKRCFTQHGGVL